MNTKNINIEDIKIGETYNVRVKVVKNDFGDTGEIATVTVDENGKEIDGDIAYYTEADAAAFSQIISENGTKNSEPTPKHDPCRMFRDGDKVTPRLVNGRDFNSIAEDYRGKILTVTRDEEKYDNVFVEHGGDEFTIDPAYLELVTPVEEQEPYKVKEIAPFDGNETRTQFDVVGDFDYVVASFYLDTHPHAKAAADAECARLNEAYRKEEE